MLFLNIMALVGAFCGLEKRFPVIIWFAGIEFVLGCAWISWVVGGEYCNPTSTDDHESKLKESKE